MTHFVSGSKAIELHPKYAKTYANLGLALYRNGHLEQALVECRKAVELDPKLALAHYRLGLCLAACGEPDQAIDAYHKTLELDPRNANVYNALGNALADKDDPEAAIEMFRKSIELDPKLALAHRNLALVLKHEGDLEEAAAQFRRAVELEPKNAWTQEHLARCQRMLALEKKMEPLLKGDIRLTKPSEQLDFAELCLWRERPVAAVRFYDAAFTARPQLAEDSKAYRYDAIVAATRAAAGRGKDVQELGEQERRSYHRQAIRWLQGHLAMRAKQIEHGTLPEKALAQKKLRLWQRRADFAVLRDPMILETLPEADRAACRKLWDEVAALLKK